MTAALVIEAEAKNLAALRDFVAQTAASLGAAEAVVDDLILAVDESATNVIVHGYQGQPGAIEAQVALENNEIVVRLYDNAKYFDPLQYPQPDLTLPLEQRPVGGLGIYLTRQFTDSVDYCLAPDGRNELILHKNLVNARARVGFPRKE
jgi:serine/threonine-protein kinase RsbW